MAQRELLGRNVLDEAVERMRIFYAEGHRIVVAFSAGKDSGCCLEVCRLAAKAAGVGPVELVMRDEEIMYPGTFEYAERVAVLPDVKFNWLTSTQAVVNVYSRRDPFWYPFDPAFRDRWVRTPPAWSRPDDPTPINVGMTTPERFPPPPGKNLLVVTGIRVDESQKRRMGIFASRGVITKPQKNGSLTVRPIYDWTDGDVWKAVADGGWDYNRCYDALFRLGVPKKRLRVAVPTINNIGASTLAVAAQAWPKWFDRVCARLDGVRQAVNFGLRAVRPERRQGENWHATFYRECIDGAPHQWIKDRAMYAAGVILRAHRRHATTAVPDITPCRTCTDGVGSWRQLTMHFYNGDPLGMKIGGLPEVNPPYGTPVAKIDPNCALSDEHRQLVEAAR